MRLFPLLCACVLSSAAQYVAAKDSSTLPSIQISNESLTTSHLPSIPGLEVIVVAMTSLATSTLDSGVDHKGSTTYDCTTYTTVVTHIYTRPKTSTMTAMHTEWSGSVSTIGGLGFGVTSVSDIVPSNTGSVSSSITTGTDTENTCTEAGSETKGSSIPESSEFSTLESVTSSPNPLTSLTPLTPTTSLDEHGSQVTTSSIPGFATTDPVPGAVLTATTDELGNIITIPNNALPTTASPIPGFITTTDAEGNAITHSNCIDFTSCLLWQTLSSDVISFEFRKLLPTFSSWEINPEPPLQTSIINEVEGVEHRIEDLVGRLGGKSLPKCPKSKRGLFDDLFDIAAGAIDTIIGALNCITKKTENLKKKIKDKDVEAVKNLLPRLISLDGKPTSTTTSAITYSTLSSISPLSYISATAYQVTVFCEPSLVTTADAETETTTCSPMTTVTITGCSATDTTTTITNTATPTDTACAQGSCGGGLCPAGDGGWVTINPIDCAKVPTVTVGGLPSTTRRPDHTVPPKVTRRVYIKHDDENPSNPLSSLSAYGSELTEHLNSLAGRLTTEGKWLSHKNGDTTGKWYTFTNEKTAAGVTGLFGCTSIVIVSKHGVYLSHIYKDPVSVEKTKLGFLRPTTDKAFQEASFNALVNGDPEYGELEPLSTLIGTTENPGPLHYTLQPKIFAVTPFKHGGIGPLMYAKRIEWLSDQLHSYIYPAGSEQYDQQPELIPYKIPPQYLAESPESLSGNIIMEATQLDHYEQSGNQLSAIGRCRLWVNGKELLRGSFRLKALSTLYMPGLHAFVDADFHHFYHYYLHYSLDFYVTNIRISRYRHRRSSPPDHTGRKVLLGGPGGPNSISWTVDNYFAEIKFDPRCEGPAQNPQYPMVGYYCQSIIKENFALKSRVTKNGFGGSLRVGCLFYNSYVQKVDDF
ncbi:hypothetical protein BJX65DRAFT_304255 [Aspergillus insuetus]